MRRLVICQCPLAPLQSVATSCTLSCLFLAVCSTISDLQRKIDTASMKIKLGLMCWIQNRSQRFGVCCCVHRQHDLTWLQWARNR